LIKFVPFDPATKMSEATAMDANGGTLRAVKGVCDGNQANRTPTDVVLGASAQNRLSVTPAKSQPDPY
jgi:hypothetical protein